MALNQVGGIWKKTFKGGRRGFAWRLKAEEIEQWLKDNPNAEFISGLGFDNSEYRERNDRAPDYTLVMSDGEDQAPRRTGRGSSSPNQDKANREEKRIADEPKPQREQPSGRRRSTPKEEEEVPF